MYGRRLVQMDGAHPIGCTAVSWSPAAPKGSLVSSKAPGQPVRRLASAGCDNCVRVWMYAEQARQWRQDGATLTGHTGGGQRGLQAGPGAGRAEGHSARQMDVCVHAWGRLLQGATWAAAA